MAKGTLDALGEQIFTDGRVRKALASLMHDPPRPLLNIVRNAMGDQGIAPLKIKASLARMWQAGMPIESPPDRTESQRPVAGGVRGSRRGKGPKMDYGESHHISGKPQEVFQLYSAIDRLCLSFNPGGVEKRFLAKCINYGVSGRAFCSVHVQQGGLRVWLWLKYGRLENPPGFARDVSNVGHWGGGDLELAITNLSQIESSAALIRESFQGRA
jgi:hypothetical protein